MQVLGKWSDLASSDFLLFKILSMLYRAHAKVILWVVASCGLSRSFMTVVPTDVWD